MFVYPYALDSYFSNTASLTRVPTCHTLEESSWRNDSMLLQTLVIEAHFYTQTNGELEQGRQLWPFLLTGGVLFNLQCTKPCLCSPTFLITVSFPVLCTFRSISYSLPFSCLVHFFLMQGSGATYLFEYFTTVMFSFPSCLC